jgi:hypothetical protein
MFQSIALIKQSHENKQSNVVYNKGTMAPLKKGLPFFTEQPKSNLFLNIKTQNNNENSFKPSL